LLRKFHTTKGFIALINDEQVFEIKASKGLPKSILDIFPVVALSELDNNVALNNFLAENKLPICQQIAPPKESGGY